MKEIELLDKMLRDFGCVYAGNSCIRGEYWFCARKIVDGVRFVFWFTDWEICDDSLTLYSKGEFVVEIGRCL